MRHFFLLILHLYLPCTDAKYTQQTMMAPPRSRRRRAQVRVRGGNRRQLSSNIFQFERDVYEDPFAGEPRYKGGLTFKVQSMTIRAKEKTTKGSKGGKRDSKASLSSSESDDSVLDLPMKSGGILDLPPKSYSLGKGNGGKKSSTPKGKYTPSPTSAPTASMGTKGTQGSKKSTKGKAKSAASSRPSSKSSKFPTQAPKLKSTKEPIGTQKPKSTKSPVTKYPTKRPTNVPTKPPSIYDKPSSSSKGSGKGKSMKMGMMGGTLHPTHVPTLAPTRLTCQVDKMGNIGSQTGDITLYDFFYRLEVIEGMTVQQIDDEFLPRLETTMANLLVPSLFPDLCGDGTIESRRRLQEIPTEKGRYTGLNVRPSDFVLDGCKFPKV